MKLYKLSQKENSDYDTYDSCIVCAENESDAKTISPDEYINEEWNTNTTWTRNLDAIKCEEIGEASDNQTRGVILSSFNAG